VQTEAVPESSVHRNVTFSSLSVNEKLGDARFDGLLGFELMDGLGGGVPSTVTVGCGPCKAKSVVPVLRLVVHVVVPWFAGAVAPKVRVSVAPGHRSPVPPGETTSIVVPFSAAVHVAAEQAPAAEVVAARDDESSVNVAGTLT
jgi:hypothetical protein